MTKKLTKADLRWFERVRSLGCYITAHFPNHAKECGGGIVVHHQLGVVRNHRLVMGLCNAHHSATTYLPFGGSIHKGTRSFEAKFTTQTEMVKWTKEQLDGGI